MNRGPIAKLTARPAYDLLDALERRRCNGCGLPAKEWGPVCGGMTQGDYTHFHSREWWIRLAKPPEGEDVQATTGTAR